MVDFIKVKKWLQKGLFLKQYSSLRSDPLIHHQSDSAREALILQVLRKMVVRKNLFFDLFRKLGAGMARKSDELLTLRVVRPCPGWITAWIGVHKQNCMN